MIELRVDEYCHNCDKFEPVKVDLSFNKNDRRVMVICEHAHLCKNIRRYLEEKMKGENSNGC